LQHSDNLGYCYLIVDDRFRTALRFLELTLAVDHDECRDERNFAESTDEKIKYFNQTDLLQLLHMMRNLANESVCCWNVANAWCMTMKLELWHNDDPYLDEPTSRWLDYFFLEAFYGWHGETPRYGQESYCKPIPFADAVRNCRTIREWARHICACPVHDKGEFHGKKLRPVWLRPELLYVVRIRSSIQHS
jgi:hypothetical protein